MLKSYAEYLSLSDVFGYHAFAFWQQFDIYILCFNKSLRTVDELFCEVKFIRPSEEIEFAKTGGFGEN